MKRWYLWAGLFISVLFVWLALRGLHLEDFWQAVRNADYVWLLPGIAVYFVAVWVRAWRWHYLLQPIRQVPTTRIFPITAIGYMGNNIYPARAGEVLRAVVLQRKHNVAVSASLATIVVERIFDGVVMLAFVFINLPELARLTSDEHSAAPRWTPDGSAILFTRLATPPVGTDPLTDFWLMGPDGSDPHAITSFGNCCWWYGDLQPIASP